MMIEALKKKMSNYEPITDKEMRFMLQNIGHVNPEIRDDLIYGLFCIGLEKEMFSIHQVKEIVRYLSENNLLFQGLEDGMACSLSFYVSEGVGRAGFKCSCSNVYETGECFQ